MRWMGRGVLAALLVLPGGVRAKAPEKKAPPPKHLCAAGEDVLFSCELARKDAKVVSLCASKDLDGERGSLKYRFGKPGKVELEFPQDARRPQQAFQYGRYTRPLVTYVGVKFLNGGYTYEVLSESDQEEGPGKGAVFSVVVTPPKGGKANTLTCAKPVTDHLMTLELKGFEPGEWWR